MRNRHVGLLILGMAVVFLFIVMSFNSALETIVRTSCTHGVSCPMEVTLKTQKAVSYSLIGILIIIGGFVAFFLKSAEKVVHHHHHKGEMPKEDKSIKLDHLDEAERTIMDIVLREEGSIYQSDIIKETKKSKVQVSRVLDKLEGKGLIERKRRGMTNVVVLK